MSFDNSQSKEVDLDRTDRLPIIEGVSIEEDVADDSVRIEHTAAMPQLPSVVTASPPAVDFSRTGSLDLPSLADSVRSVEERIARQNADYEALNKLYERARDAQLAAGTRADLLAGELAAAQSALAVDQHRVREMERLLAETNAATQATRQRVEESLRESERFQTEARTLRESLTARDSTIAQVLHSLGERDAQLNALQREHAKIVPALESRSQAGVQLEQELRAARGQADSLATELAASRQSLAAMTAKLARGETELHGHRHELTAAKAQADSYLETLRSREWRSGFNQNLFREWDAKMGAAETGQGALQAECDRLRQTAAALSAKLAEHDDTIANLHAATTTDAAALVKRAQELQDVQRVRAEMQSRIESLEAERKRLEGELDARALTLTQVRTQSESDISRLQGSLTAAEAKHADQAAQIDQLRADASSHEEEMTVLMAHLNEARRPFMSVQAEIKKLNDELVLKGLTIDQLNEDNRSLRANLERTRGALEERELLIRRLERSASNSANVLGRLQTSIERLGTTPPAAAAAAEFLAELVRLDGDSHAIYPLARRTRIGRSPGCELQIDSQSVSRNHAMLLKGPRDLIVEDLNSTNGILVNGRKVSRALLSDGDVLTVGETQFRCVLKLSGRPSEPAIDGTQTGMHAAVAAAAPTAAPPADLAPPVAAPSAPDASATGMDVTKADPPA